MATKCPVCLWSHDRSDVRSSHELESKKCIANGCPLPGVISTSVRHTAGSRSMCARHYDAKDETHLWPAITEKIKAELISKFPGSSNENRKESES